MQTRTRKGRPPAASQTMPAFLRATATRTTRELPLSGQTSKAIDDYIKWSAAKASLSEAEALFRFVDHVLAEFIRRDGLWQAERHRTGAAPQTDGGLDSPTSPGTSVGAAAPAAGGATPPPFKPEKSGGGGSAGGRAAAGGSNGAGRAA